tara:strand:- start:12034 stop:13092 length:1059 start_codon:yes stop_codon:yes gene_type:complete
MRAPTTSRGKRTDTLWSAYKLRWNRIAFLVRSWRKGFQLTALKNRTASIQPADILCFACVRNEAARLPYWLGHYRGLGVAHFLIVVNDSTDGTADFLAKQPDVSVWRTNESYRKSRFGMDWLGALQTKYAHGHWCVTVDADELLIYPQHDTRDLQALTGWLDRKGRRSFGVTMVDLYPRGRLGETPYHAGDNPMQILEWYDAYPYWVQLQPKYWNLWLRGGPRARMFFDGEPDRAPTLNKVPLVRWSRKFTYVSSTHTMLPRYLNQTYDMGGEIKATGILLHTKFLDEIIAKSAEEQERGEHFGDPEKFAAYYNALVADPVIWTESSRKYSDWRDLVADGLMEQGDWFVHGE